MTENNNEMTVYWSDGALYNIDQKLLPYEYKINCLDTVEKVCAEILNMGIRGATAIGVSGAYAVALAVREAETSDIAAAMDYLEHVSEKIASVRPTATKLKLGVSRVMGPLRLEAKCFNTVDELYNAAVGHATDFCNQELNIALRLIQNIADLMPEDGSIITHCNTGNLCNVKYGGAVGGAMLAYDLGKNVHIYVDETRPRLQGAKLNVFELKKKGMPFTLITDNMAAYVISHGLVDAVFVGSDKVAANGDTAAKIGVQGLSIIANHYNVPVYMSASTSSIDFNVKTGEDIQIEQRDPEEVRVINGHRIVDEDVSVLNPAFDITSHELLTGIITEEGIAYPPYTESLIAMKQKSDLRFSK